MAMVGLGTNKRYACTVAGDKYSPDILVITVRVFSFSREFPAVIAKPLKYKPVVHLVRRMSIRKSTEGGHVESSYYTEFLETLKAQFARLSKAVNK